MIELLNPDARRIGLSTARKMVGPHDAEDVVQTAYLRLLSTACPFAGTDGATFQTFFYQVVRREALRKIRTDRARKRDVNQTVCLPDELNVSAGETPEQILLATERRQEILKAVDNLTPARSEAIRIRYFVYPDETVDFVARQMGIEVTALKSRLCWGRRELADHLRQEARSGLG